MPAAVFARGVHNHLVATVNDHIAEHIFEIDPRMSFTSATRYGSIDEFVIAIEALPPVPPMADDDEPMKPGFQQRVEDDLTILHKKMQQVMERLERLEMPRASASNNNNA